MILEDEAATHAFGERLSALARVGDVITLSGPLGVGKTSLARGFLAGLGHQSEVPSPTFAIVQPYEQLDPPVWHVDLYRIEDPSELEQIGLDAADDAVLLVEWPERAGAAAWPDALRLSLAVDDAGARRLTADVPPAWEARWFRQ
ncbi:tRNA (adenosine(37)-N6)-threonylcarbamoyltransferase complex ATPase subunit type 1 TsaE [Sphingomonas lutea]|uniref:tRNA threonylcarbamoyladenosine biosynthesis protein TsaE n=1 Tax=Sphingomonas lutea TaxID=1045317 RepID=A0A7G9SFB3_9SPHN|nr:tRNA (adenosine(37)-N6)-threonylcarbamoyltransferase complex ATPase subunit type 1 TsaE [Sphingomonas lutea]QNN66538.1 tRNA (adenosine(37)-N6)-threonylcarbamoyltransferase complex ATPase subunit type 1 TsaE [Sphingomonas lutea]